MAGRAGAGVDVGRKLDRIRSLGADRVVDCARVDFTRGGERYDLIVDIPALRHLIDGAPVGRIVVTP